MTRSTPRGRTAVSTGDTDVVAARGLAQLVDGLVSTLAFALVTVLVGGLLGGFGTVARAPLFAFAMAGLPAMLIGSLAAAALPVVLEYHWNGATIGKRLFGLRVVSLDGGRLGLGSVLARNVLAVVDGAFFYLVGLLAMSRSRTRQRVGDRVAGTVVIRD